MATLYHYLSAAYLSGPFILIPVPLVLIRRPISTRKAKKDAATVFVCHFNGLLAEFHSTVVAYQLSVKRNCSDFFKRTKIEIPQPAARCAFQKSKVGSRDQRRV